MYSDAKYNQRVIDEETKDYILTFGAVCIEGAKWIGKTWTSEHHSKSSIYLSDPTNNFQNRSLAKISPDLVLNGETPRLIDEWQEVPSIWDAVRHRVDQTGEKGQFILTGSATPIHKGIMHSGAGRIGRIRMRPMSLYESGTSLGEVSLLDICNDVFEGCTVKEPSLDELIELTIRGGWPGNIETASNRMSLLPKQYIEAIVEDDVYRIDGISRNKDKMLRLLRSLARNETTTASNATLAKDIKLIDDDVIDRSTVNDYLDVFNRLFILDNQRPFSANIRSSSKLKKAEKRHFCDPSLPCALLGLTRKGLKNDLNTFGFLFEALCERDLRVYANTFGAELYHYQDYNNNEIDAVIQMSNGEWCAFEIKLGANQIDEAAKNLLKIDASLRRDPKGKAPKVLCVICGLSNFAYKREDGVYVVPITALRP